MPSGVFSKVTKFLLEDGHLALGMLDSGKMFYIPSGIVKGFIQRVYFYKVR